MTSIQTIDVTLRDGGYRNTFNFTSEYAQKHVACLSKAGIEWIEIGYRNGSLHPIDHIGLTGMSGDHYIQDVHQYSPDAHLAVMVHPKNISLGDIDSIVENGAEMLRICFDVSHKEETIRVIQHARHCGLIVCVNVTHVTHLSTESLLTYATIAEQAGAHILCIADSNGHLTPEKTSSLVKILKEHLHIDIDFHAHDHLGLAMANSIAACHAGATYVDASLRGMGKGTGNLRTELWALYMNGQQDDKTLDVGLILDQLQRLAHGYPESALQSSIEDIIYASHDVSMADKQFLTMSCCAASVMMEKARLFKQHLHHKTRHLAKETPHVLS